MQRWIEIGRLGCDAFLSWLLMEPVLGGTRLGIALEEALVMYETFKDNGITTFWHLLELAGAHLDNAGTLAQRLEVRCFWVVGLILDKFKKAWSSEDRALLAGWFTGPLTPDDSDLFPRMYNALGLNLQTMEAHCCSKAKCG